VSAIAVRLPAIWHDWAMRLSCIERTDRTAEGYRRWWGPILEPGPVRLVERIGRAEPALPAGEARDVIDVGCGTGSGLFEAARRWPRALLTGLDAAAGMLEIARRERDRLPEADRRRITYVQADATKLPAPNASFDLVMSSYLVQLVPDRPAVLREFQRVLRPGGLVAVCGWLEEGLAQFEPDVEFERGLAEAGVVRPPAEPRAGHYRTVRSAAGELRANGFRGVSAGRYRLGHTWDVDDYLTYRVTTRDADLFEALDEKTRRRAIEAIRGRFAALPPDTFEFRPPIVLLTARKG
jgi:SAM-dependent methyltransferase